MEPLDLEQPDESFLAPTGVFRLLESALREGIADGSFRIAEKDLMFVIMGTWVFVHGLVVVERLHEQHGGAAGDRARGLIRAYVNGLGTDWAGARRARRDVVSPRGFFTERLARRSSRRPRLTLAVWLAVAVALRARLLAWGDVLVTTDDFLTTPESKQVERLVADRLPGDAADTEVVVVSAPTEQAGDADRRLRRRVAELAAQIEAIGGGTSPA